MTMQKQTFNFTGSIHCLEPLTVSIKEAAQGARGHRLPRNGAALDSVKPYFPASSVRGALRNAAHRVVLRAVKKHSGEEHPFTIDDHFMLAQGVDSGRQIDLDKVSGVTDLNEELRVENPMLSVFGRWGMESHLAVGHGFPTSQDVCWGMYGGGARGIVFERDPNLLNDLTIEDSDRLEQILLEQTAAAGDVAEIKKEITALKKTLRGASQEEREAGNARINLLEEQIKARKQEKSGPVESIRRPLDPFEAFSADAELSHRMALRSATQSELGLLLLTLREFARDPQLGGHKAHNCGSISAQWTVTTWPEDTDAPIEVGSVAITPDGFIVNGDILKDAMVAFNTALPAFNFKRAV